VFFFSLIFLGSYIHCGFYIFCTFGSLGNFILTLGPCWIHVSSSIHDLTTHFVIFLVLNGWNIMFKLILQNGSFGFGAVIMLNDAITDEWMCALLNCMLNFGSNLRVVDYFKSSIE